MRTNFTPKSDEYYFEYMRQFASLYGRAPTYSDLTTDFFPFSPSSLTHRFGSLNHARVKAGLHAYVTNRAIELTPAEFALYSKGLPVPGKITELTVKLRQRERDRRRLHEQPRERTNRTVATPRYSRVRDPRLAVANAIAAYYALHGTLPTQRSLSLFTAASQDMPSISRYSIGRVATPDYPTFLAALGYDEVLIRKVRRSGINTLNTPEYIIETLQQFFATYQRAPNLDDYRSGRVGVSNATIRRRFGTIARACAAAGIPVLVRLGPRTLAISPQEYYEREATKHAV